MNITSFPYHCGGTFLIRTTINKACVRNGHKFSSRHHRRPPLPPSAQPSLRLASHRIYLECGKFSVLDLPYTQKASWLIDESMQHIHHIYHSQQRLMVGVGTWQQLTTRKHLRWVTCSRTPMVTIVRHNPFAMYEYNYVGNIVMWLILVLQLREFPSLLANVAKLINDAMSQN